MLVRHGHQGKDPNMCATYSTDSHAGAQPVGIMAAGPNSALASKFRQITNSFGTWKVGTQLETKDGWLFLENHEADSGCVIF